MFFCRDTAGDSSNTFQSMDIHDSMSEITTELSENEAQVNNENIVNHDCFEVYAEIEKPNDEVYEMYRLIK